MFEAHIDNAAARALGEAIVLLFKLALVKAAHALQRARPLLVPPADLEVTARSGAVYSGILLVDSGEVIASLVMLSGQRASQNTPRTGEQNSGTLALPEQWTEDSADEVDTPWGPR